MQALARSSTLAVAGGGRTCKLPSYTQLCSHTVFIGTGSQSGISQGDQRFTVTKKCSSKINCSLLKVNPQVLQGPENLDTEPHKFFDQVNITVRSGDGGHGAVLKIPKPKVVDKDEPKFKKKDKKPTGSFKRGVDGSLIMPLGGHGGDVILVAEESADTLLPLHRKKRHNAKRGANVDNMGRLSPSLRDGLSAPALRIPVPVGTVVKRKRGGKFLADLAKPGDEIMVARGGRGGISIIDAPEKRRFRPSGLQTIEDADDKVVTLGAPGEEIALELILRVVADVGLVGLPNAGKSSLLAAVTLAKPEIAAYPFTTLMPNLGCLEGDPLKSDGGFSTGPTMADLPGLIKDAHLGKGLGRMFLRHLRRTRLLVHVVDASNPDPVQDYTVLREELHLYNPEYVKRPHIVVLNKLDLPEARERFESLKQRIQNLGVDPEDFEEIPEKSSNPVNFRLATLDSTERQEQMQPTSKQGQKQDLQRAQQEKKVEDFRRPVAVVGISARQLDGMEDLLKEIRASLKKEKEKPQKESRDQQRAARTKLIVAPQWQL